jgi:hypothetical protein
VAGREPTGREPTGREPFGLVPAQPERAFTLSCDSTHTKVTATLSLDMCAPAHARKTVRYLR